MNAITRLIGVWICVWITSFSYGQVSSARSITLAPNSAVVKLDSLTIYPFSFQATCQGNVLSKDDYILDYSTGKFELLKKCEDSVKVTFRVLPIDLSKKYQQKDTSLIFNQKQENLDRYLIAASQGNVDIFGSSNLKKNGSISRGVTFGNNQDLAVNSTLNLELAGDIAPNLKILASVSDSKLPIQPDGNTNKLQEFDQVFIQVYNDKFKVIAGDFWINKPQGYFMNYKKRAQGLYGEYSWKTGEKSSWAVQGSGALSKGKFARQTIPGVEGNQGPYRLRGNENEPFIIVLSGTERVFIDGKLMERGQEFDYVINYNTAEIVFTSRKLITKDIRIVVEFQYSDQNYVRSLVQGGAKYDSEKFKFWVNAYSEQDAKNQTVQQDLSPAQKFMLSKIGDSLELARVSSLDSVGFQDNQNLYKLIDSLAIDSVLVYSIAVDSAFYRATFVYVGPNNGNYIFSNFNALGKVYKWVAPIGNIPQGDYEAARIIITPKKKQMVSAGASYQLKKNVFLETELAYTKNDLNTFSKLDAGDDQGFGSKTKLTANLPLGKDSIKMWSLNTAAQVEILHQNFNPIEQYRGVEYDRNWNTRGKNYRGNQIESGLMADLKHQKNGHIALNASQYSIGTDYNGFKSELLGSWNKKGFSILGEGSFLVSEAASKNQFFRNKLDISQSFKKIKIGVRDEHENNLFRSNGKLDLESYQFFDYEFYVANADSSKVNYRLFYRERTDQKSDSISLIQVSKARSVGGELLLANGKNQKLNLLINYRELKVNDSILLNQTPENTLLGRLDYELKLFKNTITWNTFYEIGSGLEQRREFQYLKVPDGQGIYTWIDYNNDNIKDLNEFEIAQYVDQASYIRVFTPSNEYVKTYSNELNQGIFIKPERIWATKKGIKKFASRFSNQARLRINRKTNSLDQNSFNPFSSEVRDTTLISTSSNIRNTFYFNRTSSIVGAEYVIQNTRSKSLLASGFDARINDYHEVSFRWNIAKIFTLENTTQIGSKSVAADYTSGRNYNIQYHFIKPAFSYQPSTSFRITVDGRYADKRNVDGEQAYVSEGGLKIKYNQASKGSLQGALALVVIKYNGNPGSSLGFEMLESLKTGKNYTWNIGYQRSISKSLQISVQYNGRKSENNKTIHSGGMEVRAFF
ncbi:MAG: hypothetical protein PHQ74_01850 [Crocinitomicaceae bacterium]|nr:hypothetical protein [Crocinitomicaceae bacterium]